tara:strand:- start:591 stop:821 length:231 start_codon:yes stop_codon:yes gene_type:complete
MATILKKMTNDALSLPPKDRAKLAHELIISLDQNVESNVSKAWEKEINKRVVEIHSGIAKGRPAEQVLAEIRAKYQ